LFELEEDNMKARIAFATIVAAAIALPTIASAETTVIKKYGDRDHFRGARNEMRIERDRDHDRGFFHRHGDKTVIIKKHGDRDY
jgi:Ni/Co efflux regulator RcnB